MKPLFLAAAALVAITASALDAAASNPSYHGHKVFRIPVADEEDGLLMQNLVDKLGLAVWQPPSKKGAFADMQVPADQLRAFGKAMEHRNVIIMHEDLGKSIRNESKFHDYAAGSANSSWFNSYHPYNDHLQWLNDLASQYSQNAKIVTSGKTLQGEPITGLHIFGRASSSGEKKPAVVFHGTVHAREWIASMVVEYMTHELISKYDSDAEITSFVDKYDFYMFPIVNVDGFKYTQTNDRMWRKNRQTTNGSNCLGHDINRNWPYKWDVEGGASKNPCAEDFKGTAAGDAPETKALSEFLRKVKAEQGLKLYIDYHSYSQLVMTPYGYSCTARAPNDDALQALAKGAVDAIYAVHNVEFRYGPICSTIYQASGSSVDYVADVVQAEYTFTSELRDTGEYGFILPPEQILPASEEAFAGVKYFLQNMK
ncbi:hypothetical protein E4U35_002016 [Claviceps purpurea]|nr:hypothetical protein E4U12_004271 [Claviceps purpurea]KAG6154618.1 hypothetical protein E4U37_001891 [Claviceps purpurea]KAG6166174.1 hypothetical protein E4U11_008391 [Claviceps purpurea]KAG6173311.1 hypothetical protein E4U51_005657 [Claviceps purpurea]KAG6189477.1 hypothetical protein E4U36_005022 [Claviceps purpurea]